MKWRRPRALQKTEGFEAGLEDLGDVELWKLDGRRGLAVLRRRRRI